MSRIADSNASVQRGAVCAACGRPASVTVISEDDQGRRAAQQLCLECAETRPPPRSHAGRAALLALAPRLLIRAGAVLVLIAVIADELGISGKQGFGWRQWAGSEAGALLLALGAFLRSGWLTVGGLALMVLSLGADQLRVGQHPGMGWRETSALVLGLVSVATGLFWQRRLRRRRPAEDAPPPDAAQPGSPDLPSAGAGLGATARSTDETTH